MSLLVSVKTGNIGCAAEAQKWIRALPRLMAAGRLKLIGLLTWTTGGNMVHFAP